MTLIMRLSLIHIWEPVLEQEERIMKYIPAHLKAVHEYLQRYAGKRKLYAGTTLGTYVRYIGRPQETNGHREGKAHVRVQGNVYIHTKMIVYPEGR